MQNQDYLLTLEQKSQYLKEPYKCPKCQTIEITGGVLEVEVSSCQAWQSCKCDNCGFEWNDVYTLTDIEEINYFCVD
jgi:predicted RNA-binding Zn-ribbon protein involved in translation (DUF1610 family)